MKRLKKEGRKFIVGEVNWSKGAKAIFENVLSPDLVHTILRVVSEVQWGEGAKEIFKKVLPPDLYSQILGILNTVVGNSDDATQDRSRLEGVAERK